MKKLLILAALATVSVGQPAFAQDASANPLGNPSVVVQHKDLDLATKAGAKALDRRIWRAVVEVCGPVSNFDLAGTNDVRQCRRDTRQLATAQADAVIASAARAEPIRVSALAK